MDLRTWRKMKKQCANSLVFIKTNNRSARMSFTEVKRISGKKPMNLHYRRSSAKVFYTRKDASEECNARRARQKEATGCKDPVDTKEAQAAQAPSTTTLITRTVLLFAVPPQSKTSLAKSAFFSGDILNVWEFIFSKCFREYRPKFQLNRLYREFKEFSFY